MTKIGRQASLQALEEDILKKRAEMSELLDRIQDIPSQVTGELDKTANFGDLKKVGDAVAEMERVVTEKQEGIQNKLREIQDEMASLKELRDNVMVEDHKQEMQSLLKRVKEKKESLEKAIQEVDQLREHYGKIFLGK